MESGDISEAIFRNIVPVGSTRPQMHGLPKVHKQSTPLRPILSMCGSAQYDTLKWLCKVLEPVVQFYSKRCVKDSFTFSDAIKQKDFPNGGYMCSFDVVSLFTNVPLNEVIDICADALYRNDDIETEFETLTEPSLIQVALAGVDDQ